MKLLYLLHILFYSFLIYLGFYYIDLDAALWEEFSRVGWENYDGPSLKYPEDSYFSIAAFASVVTAVAWGKKFFENSDVIAVCGLCFSIMAAIVYISLYSLDGDASVKEAQFVWIFISVWQILIALGSNFNTILTRMVRTGLKQLFFLNGILYLIMCGLGFYFLNWDLVISAEQERLGVLYQGTDKDFPENTYHFTLVILSLISLILGMFVKKQKVTSRIYKGIVIILFLYSAIVTLNDGNLDMEETQSWWVYLTILTSIFSFILYMRIEDKLPEKEEEIFYDDNVLDDLSSLE